MLSGIDLACLRGGRQLFQDISLQISRGEVLHLTGANGAGKTTLLRILSGLTLPESGRIEWQGQPIDDIREDYHQQLLYLGHAHALHADLTPAENLQHLVQLHQHVSLEDIHAALHEVGLGERIDVPAKYLSQGQKRRIGLARLLLSEAALWLLDEPFAALDVSAIDWLNQKILQYVARGGMVILTTHQELIIEEQVVIKLEIGV